MNLVLAIDKPISTYPAINNVQVFSGEGDPSLTRQFAAWNNLTVANLNCKVYTSISTVSPLTTCNPWSQNVPVQGTDGYAFSPGLSKSSTIEIFNAEMMRSIQLKYVSTNNSFAGAVQ